MKAVQDCKYSVRADLLGNMQAVIITANDVVYQIVQVDSTIYFAVNAGNGWTPLHTFAYAELWRERTGDYRPWSKSFKDMVEAFISDATSEEE